MQPQDGRFGGVNGDVDAPSPDRPMFDFGEDAIARSGRPPKRYRLVASSSEGRRSRRSGAPERVPRVDADLSRRLASAAFAAYLVVAAVLLVRFGDGLWFASDDWGFLDGRSLGSFDDLMLAQNGHWVTLPVVLFQLLYGIFGVDSYTPFLLATITLHLTLCVLIRLVMGRAGVGPWLASVAAGTFVLFGAGFENLLFALQITLVGSLVFGFAQLLLADHDGPVDRRDGAALLCGLLGLMCSSVGIAMVAVVAIAVLIRRGWRMALLQSAPLVAIFVGWFLWQRSSGNLVGSGDTTASVTALGGWLRTLLSAAFTGIGGSGAVAAALALMLIGGGTLAMVARGRDGIRRTLAVPLALLVGAVVLAISIGSQRSTLVDLFPSIASSPRYQAMVAAMVLPAIAVAGAELIRRWRVAAPAVVALLVVGIPANIGQFDADQLRTAKAFSTSQRSYLVTAAEIPISAEVDADVHPNPNEFGPANVTVGFLRAALADGKLPDVDDPDPILLETVATHLRISQGLMEDDIPPATCGLGESFDVVARKGDRFVLETSARISIADPDGTYGPPFAYNIDYAGKVVTSQFDQAFRVLPAKGATTVVWCTVG
jgi:hypothetical protein